MGRTARTIPQGKYILRTPKIVEENQAYPIYLYYYCGGRQIRESTSICARVDDWNNNKGELKASFGLYYKKRNDYLQKQLRRVDNCIFEYVEKNGSITPEVIKCFLNKDYKVLRKDKGRGFLGYAREVLKKRYERGKIRVSTFKNAETNINQFEKFLKSEQGGKSDIFVGDITEDVVRDFIRWGLQRKRKIETVKKYQGTISKVCGIAATQGLLSQTTAQVIADIGLERNVDDETRKSVKYLTGEELRMLAHVDRGTLTKRQTDALDCFIFAYTCALRISDVLTLRWTDIDFEKKELDKNQVKTRKRNIIPLKEESLEILGRWKDRHEVFVFGLLPDNFDLKDEEELRKRRNSITSTFNKSLKKISKRAQLDKKVTFHYARHSWANNALEQGMAIKTISELMGHRSTAITEKVYTICSQSSKAEAVRNLNLHL